MVLVVAGFLFILNQGYWKETTETLALVLAATGVSMVVGVPLFATFYGLAREFVHYMLDKRGLDSEGNHVGEVVEDEENPGYYMGKFYLKPHFQLEGMDVGMSLVSKLPKGK